MSIKSLCRTNIVTVEKGTTLQAVAHLMQEKHVGSVLITEGTNGKRVLSGIITDRDIALTLGSSSKPQELKVDQLMRSQPVTVKANDGIFETIIKMREYGVKRMPVVNDDGSLYGIICADDVLNLMAEEMSTLAKITGVQVSKEKGVRTPVETFL